MGLHQELQVYKARYNLLISIFKFSSHFKKEYKCTVVESLKKETIGLLTLIYRANSRKDKLKVLQEAREYFIFNQLFEEKKAESNIV